MIEDLDILDPKRLAVEASTAMLADPPECDCSCVATTKVKLTPESYKHLNNLNFWRCELAEQKIKVDGGSKVDSPLNKEQVYISMKNKEKGGSWNDKLHIETHPSDRFGAPKN